MPGPELLPTRPRRLAGIASIALSVSMIASAASAGDSGSDLGTCTGVDYIEAHLQTSSSGYFIPGLKLIIMNRARLDGYALPVQKFIFEHECAHADPAVGEDEDAADCAAARRGRQEGWLGKPEIIQICVHLSRMPVDATHKPVYFRCANIRRCIEEADRDGRSTEQALLPSEILRR